MNRTHLVLAGYLSAFILGATLTVRASTVINTYTAGKVLGVWSLTALTFQLLLVTRMDILESAIGYDRITRWHAVNGMLIILLVASHPLLIFASMGFGPADIVAFVQSTPATWLGELAIVLLLFQAVTTLYWTGLDYERWRLIHRIGYVIVALGFIHSFLLGSDITVPPTNLISVWWLTLAGVAGGSVLYRYGYRPLRKQRTFHVMEVQQETHDVHTIALQPEDGETDIQHNPGQFAFVTFESDNIPVEEHHFTIVSAPDREGFEYTVKAVGDFTAQLGALDEGDTAIVEGPYGTFTLDNSAEDIVMIAGGIGITPFMSMLRHMNREDSMDTHLFYGNRTREDIVFHDELADLEQQNDWLTVTHVLSDEDMNGYEHGFIDANVLEDTVEDADSDTVFYICGPPPMMDAVEDALTDMGVDRSQIRTERFSLRDIDLKRLLPFR